ncbi:MAG: hypothetical protein WD490_04715, partial [Opitutales bacterium]
LFFSFFYIFAIDESRIHFHSSLFKLNNFLPLSGSFGVTKKTVAGRLGVGGPPFLFFLFFRYFLLTGVRKILITGIKFALAFSRLAGVLG